MTTFEIIILIIIYMFCYGYTATNLKEKDTVLKIFLTLISLVIAIFAPIMIGMDLYDKLNKN